MEQKKVDYIVYESAVARMERQVKKWHITCLLIFAAFVISNALWITYEMQYEDETTTVTQEVDSGDGDATVIGIGDNYGESKADGK